MVNSFFRPFYLFRPFFHFFTGWFPPLFHAQNDIWISGRTGTEDVELENYFEGMVIDVFIDIEATVDVQHLGVIDFSGNLGGQREPGEQVGSADNTIKVYGTHTLIGVTTDIVVLRLNHP